ncbi:MAG TPA: acyltransferase [Polyangia bacterium]|nr:acyltransferase [Polyangia bacterium]
MPSVARIVKSLRNRATPLSTRLRGAAMRTLMPGLIDGGARIAIGRGVELVVYGELIIGENVILSGGCSLQVGPGARLTLGNRVFVGRGTVIAAHESIEIGDDTIIAEHCSVRDQDHQLLPEARLRLVESKSITAPVTLAENVWLGAGARVLRGSHIGAGAVVGANAVVRGQVPARVVVAGIPARILKSLEEAGAK